MSDTTEDSLFEVRTGDGTIFKGIRIIVTIGYIFLLVYMIYFVFTQFRTYGANDVVIGNTISIIVILLPLLFILQPKLFKITSQLSGLYTIFSYKKPWNK